MSGNPKLKKLSPEAFKRYARTAKRLGVPKDTFQRFHKARYVAQEKQLEFHASARLADKIPELVDIGYGGARGGGKTYAIFAQIALDDCQRVPNLKVLYLRKHGGAISETLDELAKSGLLANIPHKASGRKIKFANGSQIIIGHFQYEKDINKYLGQNYQIIAIEEATQLSESKIINIKTCNRASRRMNFKPRVYYSTNPGGVGHQWFKDKFIVPFRDEKSGKKQTTTRFIPATVDDNAQIDENYIKNNLDTLVGWQLKAWRFGDWDVFAGQFFDRFKYDEHTFDIDKSIFADYELPTRDIRIWGSMDWGFQHYNTFYLFAKYDGMLYTLGESCKRQANAEEVANGIKEVVNQFSFPDGETLDVFDLEDIVAGSDVFKFDGERGTTLSDEYGLHDIILNQANQTRLAGASKIYSLLGDSNQGKISRVRISRSCRMLIKQLPAMLHDEKTPGDVKKVNVDEFGKGGDDAYDGWRYGVMEFEDSVLGLNM